MEKDQLISEMTELIRKSLTFSNNKIEIRPDSDFVTDLGLDSMGIVDIVMRIEEKYNINIQDHEITQLKTPDNAVELVISKLT